MDLDETQSCTPTPMSPQAASRLSYRYEFTSNTAMIILDDPMDDTTPLFPRIPFSEVHSIFNETHSMAGKDVQTRQYRVSFCGRLLRLGLVPHSSLRFTGTHPNLPTSPSFKIFTHSLLLTPLSPSSSPSLILVIYRSLG